MRAPLSLARRSDRFAAGLFAIASVAITAAALVPVAPGRSEIALRSGLGLPTPPGAPIKGGYRRASPFDPQHRPVDGSAILSSEPEPVVEIGPAAEAPSVIAGILVGGGARKVMFAGGAGWQGIGSAAGSWTVASIDPQRVTLQRGGETVVLGARDALLPR